MASAAACTSACMVPLIFSIRSLRTASWPSHLVSSTVRSFAAPRTLASLESNSGAIPLSIGLGGTTTGVPNSFTETRMASTHASASLGTLCADPFSSASTTASPHSSSSSSMHVSVARSTVLGRPPMPFATTFARMPAECVLA